jgi:hypothetical protein
VGERLRDVQAAREPGAEAPGAEREVAGVIEQEERAHRPPGRRAESEQEEREHRAERQPRRPHEAVADAAERTTERGAEPLDARRRLSVELGTDQSAHRDGREVRVRVEVLALPRERRAVRLAAATAREEP